MDDFSRNRKKRWDVIPAIAMIAITFSADIRRAVLPANVLNFHYSLENPVPCGLKRVRSGVFFPNFDYTLVIRRRNAALERQSSKPGALILSHPLVILPLTSYRNYSAVSE